MGLHTEIQFADRTANPQMGCDSGCELSPTHAVIEDAVTRAAVEKLPQLAEEIIRPAIRTALADHTSSEVFHLRKELLRTTLKTVAPKVSHREKPDLLDHLEQALKQLFVCYSQASHLRYGRNQTKPGKLPKPGFAADFERPILTPGKVSAAARAPDLFGTIRADKPWMDYLPTVIFLSDMGDSFGPAIPFDYLKTEVIDVVRSPHGVRHIWLWFTKQPRRMGEFARWLEKQGLAWPDNIVAVTSVTSRKTARRIDLLRDVPAKFRAVSVEPLCEKVDLKLDGIDWCIVGGQSGWYRNKPFDVDWARHLRDQCRAAGSAFFLKQLGNEPMERGVPMRLKSATGGDWDEFPGDLRIREMPPGFGEWGLQQMFPDRGKTQIQPATRALNGTREEIGLPA